MLGDEELTLDYVLSGDDDVTRTGTVAIPAGENGAQFDANGLPVGRYQLSFFEGGEEPMTVQKLEMPTCLVTAVQCRQVTLTKPVTNPSVGAFYGEGPGEQEEFQDFDLEPGQRRVVRTDSGVIQWGAGTVEGGAGDNLSIAGAGDGELADAGARPFALAGLVGGCVLTAAGVITLPRRRATRPARR